MRKYLIYLIGLYGLMTACSLERSNNGDLDGMWYLRMVDTLETGGVTDMRELQYLWNVQGKILEVRSAVIGDVKDDVIFSFEHTKDSLKLSSPYFSDRDHGDIPVEDVESLSRFGINELEEGYKVLELSSDDLLLQSKILRLHFRKY